MDRPYQELLPYFQQQEDDEISRNYQRQMALKWFFCYYKHCSDPEKRIKIIKVITEYTTKRG